MQLFFLTIVALYPLKFHSNTVMLNAMLVILEVYQFFNTKFAHSKTKKGDSFMKPDNLKVMLFGMVDDPPLDLRVNGTIIRDQFLLPAIPVTIREQLFEVAIQNVTSAGEARVGKKGRRGSAFVTIRSDNWKSEHIRQFFREKVRAGASTS
ncbi:hypothetical protein H6P81_007710 [Aristolochia fimbriata]|uniref:Uncharacterized protein n=1 Tax=Aristolochia fimbriata TaxID=158543 RepID=A0AAV7F297_ARIFI|nr:hypothetical protein H6P81_007710 [Aristolochia fimbriata]